LHVSRVTLALERAGVEPLHVEGLREDYAETLSHWIERLDANLEQAERLAGAERVRVWRLYLRAARNGFRTGFTSIFQILGRRA
jgi:cyclopropane-fatty-acyl-phospholipid synthase